MIKFKLSKDVTGKNVELEYNLPTKLSEIPLEYLVDKTTSILVAPNYSLIALVCKETPSVIISNAKKKNNGTSMCIPLFIKTAVGTSAKEFVAGLHLGDKLIMTGSDIAISQTVAGEDNVLDINYFLAIVNENPTIYKDSILIQDKACFVSFKVVPNSYIHGHRFRVNDRLKSERSSSNLTFIHTSSTGELDK
jgi:hypothetical protein